MSEIVLSPGQQAAKTMVENFVRQKDCRVAVLTGYAGTGKTTLIEHLKDGAGEQPHVLAPTGKAALRVGEATGIFAMTLHRFLYTPSEDPKSGRPIFRLKEAWDEQFSDMEGALVLVDEASMVDKEVWDDLIRVAVRQKFFVLLMGDLFQLPPVMRDKEGDPFSTLNYDTPFKVNLTEVIRQALDSPIIKASMLLRSGHPEYEAMMLLKPVGASKLIESVIDIRSRGGASICFTNKRRHSINNSVRARMGFQSGTLEKGEPLLVTQNNYDLNVYNGEVIDFSGWEVPPCPQMVVTDRFTTSSVNMSFGVASMNKQRYTASPEEVTGATELANVGGWIIRRTARNWHKANFADRLHHEVDETTGQRYSFREGDASHLDANYGYALTCHKSQGSEWPEILIVMEEALGRMSTVERKRWLYTAITRAKTTTSYIYVKGDSL